jgi:branched-chain amino acid transport system ATP-binding protein
MPLLEVAQAEVRFGGVHALCGVNLTVDAGTVTGLIGPNGAGKTTCFNAICGLQTINSGRISFDGTDMTGLKPHKRARLGIARTFQRLEIFGSLSVRENVLAAAEIRRRWSHDRSNAGADADALLALVGLTPLAGRSADTLPTGQARLLELARSLATRPRLLLLDEPSSGLSDTESEELGDLLCQLAEGGMGVLLVEHDMELVMRICTNIHVLDFGAVLMAGTPAEVRADDRVRAAYLGSADDPGDEDEDEDAEASAAASAAAAAAANPDDTESELAAAARG